MYHLPGRRFAAERAIDLPWLVVGVGWHLHVGVRRTARAIDGGGFDEAARRWARSVLSWLDVDLRIVGLDRVDWSEPHVVVALHESVIDPLLLLATVPAPLRFVVRDEIATWPTVGRHLTRSGQIVLTPERPLHAARTLLRQGPSVIAAGLSPVVFAQGTVLGIETAFQPGAASLAERAGVRVVPVVIAGTHTVYEWPFSPLIRRGRPIYLEVLAPVDPRRFAALEQDLRGIALGNGHAPVRRFDPGRDGWWDGYRYSIAPEFADLAGRLAEHRGGRGHPAGRRTPGE